MTNVANEEKRYDYIVVGAGTAGSVLAAELSAVGAQVPVMESGGPGTNASAHMIGGPPGKLILG